MSRLAFLADVHADDLGSAVNPATGLNRRFEDALQMVRWVADDATARECDALVVLGDLTEHRHPAPWRVALVADALSDFRGPKVLLRGNHDGIRARVSVVDVLASMLAERDEDGAPTATGFSAPGVAWPLGVAADVAICAIPYLDRSWARAQDPALASAPDADVYRHLERLYLEIARGLYAHAVKARPERVLLAVHQSLAGGRMTEQQAAFLGGVSLVVDEAALAAIGFDAVVAGHFHMHQVLREDPLVLYVGSPHRVTFQEEAQPKGYVVIDTDRLPAFEFVETPARRFVTLRWGPSTTRDQLVGDVPPDQLEGAIVRVLDVPPGEDTASIRRHLEALGVLEIGELRVRPAEAPAPLRGLGEALAPGDALAAFLEGDPDRAALLELGRAILEEAAA